MAETKIRDLVAKTDATVHDDKHEDTYKSDEQANVEDDTGFDEVNVDEVYSNMDEKLKWPTFNISNSTVVINVYGPNDKNLLEKLKKMTECGNPEEKF